MVVAEQLSLNNHNRIIVRTAKSETVRLAYLTDGRPSQILLTRLVRRSGSPLILPAPPFAT